MVIFRSAVPGTVGFFSEHFNQKFLICSNHDYCVIIAAMRCLQLLIILHRRLTAYDHISRCCEHWCLTAPNAALHFCIIDVSLYVTVAVMRILMSCLMSSITVILHTVINKVEKKVTVFVCSRI